MEIPANAAHMLPSSTQRSLVSVDPRMLPAYQGGDRPPAVCAEDEIQKRLWSYDKAIEATPEVCKLHFFKARLLRKLGRLAEAEVCLRTAHELQPTSARVVALLADLLGRQGQLSGAARVLETAIELTEDDRDRWREQLVGLLLAGRRYEEAARQITSLVQRNPRPELATMLTRALDGLTRDAEANVAPSARAKFEQAAESLREGHPAEAEKPQHWQLYASDLGGLKPGSSYVGQELHRGSSARRTLRVPNGGPQRRRTMQPSR